MDNPRLQNFKFSEMPDGSIYVELIPQKTSRTATKNVRDFKDNPYKTPTLTKGLSEDKTPLPLPPPPPSIPDDPIAFIQNLVNLLPEDFLVPDGCNFIAGKLQNFLSKSSEPIKTGENALNNTIITWFHLRVPPVIKIIGSKESFPEHELIFINFYGKNIVLHGYCEFYSIYAWKEWLVSDYETNQSQFSLLKTILEGGIADGAVLIHPVEIQISQLLFSQLYRTIIFPDNFVTSNIGNINREKINLIKTTPPENLVIKPVAITLMATGKLIAPLQQPKRGIRGSRLASLLGSGGSGGRAGDPPRARLSLKELAALQATAQDPPPSTPQMPE